MQGPLSLSIPPPGQHIGQNISFPLQVNIHWDNAVLRAPVTHLQNKQTQGLGMGPVLLVAVGHRGAVVQENFDHLVPNLLYEMMEGQPNCPELQPVDIIPLPLVGPDARNARTSHGKQWVRWPSPSCSPSLDSTPRRLGHPTERTLEQLLAQTQVLSAQPDRPHRGG